MMPIEGITAGQLAVGVYGGVGLLLALAFAFIGVQRIDPAARGASLGFRLVILPAALALWPLLLVRWIAGYPRGADHAA